MLKSQKIQFSAGQYTSEITQELEAWKQQKKIHRLWARDASLWTNTDESDWMGWLDIASQETLEVPRILALAREFQQAGVQDIVVLGMGGSSLFPAMIAKTFSKIEAFPQLHVLDSTDPMQIRHLEQKINIEKTRFIVSSKSGSTLEPNIFEKYFYVRLQNTLQKKEVGNYFVAITDLGTSLDKLAQTLDFKAIFHGVASIGGRYSALSNFGMVPAGLMGIDIQTFLHHAQNMQKHCSPQTPTHDNPGVLLGVILGVCAQHQQDKITLIVSPEIEALGAWLEQLIAESTGKNGKGLIPIDQEPLGPPTVYSSDRVFVYIRLSSAPSEQQDEAILHLKQSGFTVIQVTVSDKMHLGAELFCWEIATDVASSILGIDPFDQPDVEESKRLTIQLTDKYEHTGHLDKEKAFFSENNLALLTDKQNLQAIQSSLSQEPSLATYLHAHLSRITAGDYVNFSAFIEMSDENIQLLQRARCLIRDHKHVATTLGFGPRFLHSTGQDYKGGANTGVFFQITADYSEDIDVPETHYTFGIVIQAQANADFSVLTQRSRRIIRVHLGKDIPGGLKRFNAALKEALNIS